MSFSTDIKKELSQINDLANKQKVKYELMGYLISDNITRDGKNIRFSTESEYNINRFSKLLKNVNIEDFFIDIQGKIYSIRLKNIYLENIEKEEIDKIKNIEYIKSIVRGVFLGSGSINTPENKYHLEISFGKEKNRDIIKKMLEENNIKVKTIEKYITSLEESFIIYKASRYNIKGKEYLKSLEKYYVSDIGLRNFMLGKKAMDAGHILENIVYLELLRRGYKVYVGKIDDMEIDFVAQNEQGNTYIQVSASVRDENTLARELKPLKAVKDNYPKIILTLDDDPDGDYDGIIRKNALDWIYR